MALNYLVNIYIGKWVSNNNININGLQLLASDVVISFHNEAISTQFPTGESNGRIAYSDGTLTTLGQTLFDNYNSILSSYKPIIAYNGGTIPNAVKQVLNTDLVFDTQGDGYWRIYLYFKGSKKYVSIAGNTQSYGNQPASYIFDENGNATGKYFPLVYAKMYETSYNPIQLSIPSITLDSNNHATKYSQITIYTRQGGSNIYVDRQVTNQTYFLSGINEVIGGVDPVVPADPYTNAGDSTTGGGDGTFDGSSDPVPVPSLPSVGATDTGFITLFVPTRAQLKQVAEYMWGGLFDVSTWKRLFEDPMDCILGLSVVPVTVPATASGNITVGNIELSGISLPIADQQYIEVDCGTIDFTHRYFGSYLDFEPYTKMSLFVPYSGVHSVSADDIIGKVVGLKYHIDILTGSLVAFLTCGDSVLYEFNGACASNIPVNSMNYASTIENAIRIAVNIGTTVATAGASAPVQGISQAQQTARNIGTGISLAGSTTEGALSLKPNIDRAGSLGGTTGLMGHQIPYFIITRPRLCKPKNQDFFQGYPSFIQTTIGDLIGKGFTSFTNIIIAESFMTDAENEELENILQGGVYL